jgi:peptidoglycan hydrolase FlgJ
VIDPHSSTTTRFERSRETQAPGPRVSTSLDTNKVGIVASPDPREAALRAAAEAFEAVFLRQVIGSMRQAKLGDDLFGSAATDQFRDMADARLADNMADQGSFGIADLLLQQFRAVLRPAGPAPATPPAPSPAHEAPENRQ